jgi:hypothetical protein
MACEFYFIFMGVESWVWISLRCGGTVVLSFSSSLRPGNRMETQASGLNPALSSIWSEPWTRPFISYSDLNCESPLTF